MSWRLCIEFFSFRHKLTPKSNENSMSAPNRQSWRVSSTNQHQQTHKTPNLLKIRGINFSTVVFIQKRFFKQKEAFIILYLLNRKLKPVFCAEKDLWTGRKQFIWKSSLNKKNTHQKQQNSIRKLEVKKCLKNEFS